MPYIPSIQSLQANTPNILNAIRNDLGGTYADLVPIASDTQESIRAIGQAVMENNMLQNSFLHALMNRIGMTIITSKSYTNPWSAFKKGMLEFGETIEEIFVQLASPYQFNPDDSETTVYKQYKPDVETAFHRLNFAKFYPQTVTEQQLKQAFLSMSGVTDLMNRIIESMYTGMEYDEFIMMKYLLAKTILAGKITAKNIPAVTTDNLKSIITTIKSQSKTMEYLSSDYNMAGVKTFSKVSDQHIILTADFESKIDVEVLASAFNMDKAEFMGHRVGIDGFNKVDNKRLQQLLEESNESFEAFTSEELAELATLPAIIIDSDFFMIFDNLQEMKDVQNPKGLYWNYFLHVWKTFSISPFANAVLFTTLTPAVTSVSTSPATATVAKGSKLLLTSSVVATGFSNEAVIWSVDSTKSTITPDGQLTVALDETETTLTVTATSIFDGTKTDTSVITVA